MNRRISINGKGFVIDQTHKSAGKAQKAALARGYKWALVPGVGWATLIPTDLYTGIAIDKEPLK